MSMPPDPINPNPKRPPAKPKTVPEAVSSNKRPRVPKLPGKATGSGKPGSQPT